jgi:hypothetical protein
MVTRALDAAEATLLLAVRRWVADCRRRADPLPRLCEALDAAGADDAAFSVDRLMEVVARTARRPVAVRCPRCPNISGDEQQLLYAASLVQADEGALAERVLRTALLSAQGAAFAIGALEGVAELFRRARLVFTRRWGRAGESGSAGGMAAWEPALAERMIH